MKREHDLKIVVDNRIETKFCRICAAEGKELTADCPRFEVAQTYRNRVAAGELDYVGGSWRKIKKAG